MTIGNGSLFKEGFAIASRDTHLMPPDSKPTADTNIPISNQLRDTLRVECAKRGGLSYDQLLRAELQLKLGE
jgi:hypothetical protein